MDAWDPQGGADGPEFRFLLGLIQEQAEREKVMRFVFFVDQKRALVARLLVRQASATALGRESFEGIVIRRTKGGKPFLASPLPDLDEAPNWNVNCSHEGSWVVCASEPLCAVGVDVAELRRLNKNGEPIDFKDTFEDNLTELEWREVDRAGADPDDQYEVFSRFWSAKEAFVKARGDGLAFPLGKAEFHWTPLEGFPDRSAYAGSVVVEGREAPQWRFTQYRMPGATPHWTTVARGPLTAVIDANGVFRSTLRRPQASFTEEEWREALLADSPPFDVIPVGALVPQVAMEGFVRAGGTRWP